MDDANRIALFKFVSREVHPNDEMFRVAKMSMPELGKAFHYYFYSGGLLAQRVGDFLLENGRRPARMSVLDFACGYGRVSRYFDLMFHHVTCSDLEPQMMEFCRANFGADVILSNVDATALQVPSQAYDLVFSFSLLTHLNPQIWNAWFGRLASAVAPGGYLIFSTRSPEFARNRGEIFDENTGIGFAMKNETEGRLDLAVYGETTVSRAYVDQVADDFGGVERVGFFPGGTFDLFHDMHMFRKTGSVARGGQ